jgi:uncharacterized damage-inducible protein DinB
MIRIGLALVLLCLGLSPRDAFAQPAGDPLTSAAKRLSDFVDGHLIKSAEKMPEASYSFQPTPDVRTFGAILGHLANSNYNFCSQASGKENPSKVDIEKTVTTKAALVKALGEAIAYCDAVFATMNDRTGSEIVKSMGGEFAKLGVLGVNTAHNFEHYGNVITYLRIKGLVPPSSEKAP